MNEQEVERTPLMTVRAAAASASCHEDTIRRAYTSGNLAVVKIGRRGIQDRTVSPRPVVGERRQDDGSDSMLNESTLERAQRLAERGLSVIPLKPKGKEPACLWRPYQHRRADDTQLREWFTGTPVRESRNIGIVAGAVSGVVVIDTDSDDAEQWASENLPLTEMRTKTRKGKHRFYRHPGGRVANGVRVAGGDLDVRGDGGYVVSPGSEHPGGGFYEAEGSWPVVSDLPAFDLSWIASPRPQAAARRGTGYRKREPSGQETVPDLVYSDHSASYLISQRRDTANSNDGRIEISSTMPTDPAAIQRSQQARAARLARWRKDLDRFERLWEMRRAFRRGTRNHAVLVYAYLLARNEYDLPDVQRFAAALGRQCAPPLKPSEIDHQTYCGAMFALPWRRETIDRYLGVLPEERERLDPEEHARLTKAIQRLARGEALTDALLVGHDKSSRQIAAQLAQDGFPVSFKTVARWRNSIERIDGTSDVRWR